MDFELTDEQQMFRDTLRAFVHKEIMPGRLGVGARRTATPPRSSRR